MYVSVSVKRGFVYTVSDISFKCRSMHMYWYSLFCTRMWWAFVYSC